MHVTRLQVYPIAAALLSVGAVAAFRGDPFGQDADMAAFRTAERVAMDRASMAFGTLTQGMPGYELVCGPLVASPGIAPVEQWQAECLAASGIVRGALTMSGPRARPDCISWSDSAPATPEAREALRGGGPARAAWHWICATGFAEPGEAWKHVRTDTSPPDGSAVHFQSGSRRLMVCLNRRSGGLRMIAATRAPTRPPQL